MFDIKVLAMSQFYFDSGPAGIMRNNVLKIARG